MRAPARPRDTLHSTIIIIIRVEIDHDVQSISLSVETISPLIATLLLYKSS